jgi:superfamily II DNA or RNA helicase
VIVQGYLCPLRKTRGHAEPDTDQLHVRGGEYGASEVEELMDDENLVRSACREIVEHTRERILLIFAAGVKHGQHVAEILRPGTTSSVASSVGTLPSIVTKLAAFPQPASEYLCNVNVLTTGFDVAEHRLRRAACGRRSRRGCTTR